MNKFKTTLLAIAMALGLVAAPLAMTAVADCTADSSAADCLSTGAGNANTPNAKTDSLPSLLKTIVNLLLYLLGAIAVIVIVIGGIRYTTSNGEAANTKAAKDMILYAVVGLVVAIMAYAIVNFVISSFK